MMPAYSVGVNTPMRILSARSDDAVDRRGKSIYYLPARLFLAFCFLLFVSAPSVAAQSMGGLAGVVLDPSGAAVPQAKVTISSEGNTFNTKSGGDGAYSFQSVPAGTYSITVTAQGFVLPQTSAVIEKGRVTRLNLSLNIATQEQNVEVGGENAGVSVNPDENASAMVIKGSALDALSDDPDELQNELEALAGPAAGPNGGAIYIDGFEGGQLPPKSSILEVRVNQNPFSAEFDRLGYGRIEIITKPGTQKLHGGIIGEGSDSALNTANPFLTQQPSYYLYGFGGNINGPLSKTATYFLSAQILDRQNQSIINALNPATLSTNISEPFPSPATWLNLYPRVDFQAGKNNFVSIRDRYGSYSAHGLKVGALILPDQAVGAYNWSNEVQIGDTWVVNSHLLMQPQFDWRRVSNSTTPNLVTPAVTVQGAFTGGGNNLGFVRDHQDVFTLQDYGTATAGRHTMRFGARARAYRDADYTTANSNGSYYFATTAAYQAKTPAQYSATVIANPLARVLLFDGSLFLQDDWRVNRSFLLGLGLRYEGQNYIHDHADWAPRVSLAWIPGRSGKTRPKTVIRAGYGWFYNRFIMNMTNPSGAEPYILPAIRDNLINQKSYVVANPNFFNPNAPEPPSVLAGLSSSIPSFHSVDPHFHAALDMQAGVGVDRQITKRITGNITYLYTQGVHQYYTNNVTAPAFDPATYTITGPAPAVYNYQFQSGGFYRQNELIFSSSAALRHLSLTANYVLNEAKSDTQGINSFPSIARHPGFDYGRAVFGIRHRFLMVGSYTAPYGFVFAALVSAQSGTPYNVTIGNDLTGNNQFNARPTYGTCGAADVVATRYGCLDADPVGKNEPIVPYGIGLGPANAVVHLRVSKVIGIGPRIEKAGTGQTYTPGRGQSGVSGRGIGSGGGSVRLDATAPRRYNLTLVAGAQNLFNIVNLGTPNGVLLSPLFGKTQTLASGQFSNPTPGTRTIVFQANLSF